MSTGTPPPSGAAVEIFLDAAEQDPHDRDAFVARACAGDSELEARVRELLVAHVRAEAAFQGTASTMRFPALGTDPFEDEVRPGSTIGPYEIVREIAEGGFGTVWLAHQTHPVRRTVALKVLKPGMDSREVITRFEAERQALALMDHPNIARVFDGGQTDRGRPYFVMEYVEGLPLTDHCDARHETIEKRLELFETVCLAVHHAHGRGVVHRDIKPNNVLVADVDGQPVVKVIDFGIAKAIGAELTDKTLATFGGQVIGTPAYMSPEQARGDGEIDHRCDVYSLGALLYELLTGVTPLETPIRGIADLTAALDAIRERDPVKPSTRIRMRDGLAPVRARYVRGDLDWIVLRCLAKDPDERYTSVEVLAHEIDRHLRREPVLAGPPSVTYRLRRYWRRHRTLLASTLLVVLTLAAATVISWRQADLATAAAARERLEAERARTELAKSDAMSGFLEHVLTEVSEHATQSEDVSILRQTLTNASELVHEFSDDPLAVAAIRLALSHYSVSLGMPQRALEDAEACVAARVDALGADAPDTLEAHAWLGDLLLQLGRDDRARAELEDCLARTRARFGPDAAETTSVRATHAMALARTGAKDAAIPELRATLALHRNRLGDTAEPTLRVLNNLGGVLEDLGQTAEAEACYREAYESQLQENGTDHLQTLKSLTNLARVRTRSDPEEAVELLRTALDAKRRLLAPGHLSLLTGIFNLGQALDRIDADAEAVRLRREGLAMAEAHLDPMHPSRLAFTISVLRDRLRADPADRAPLAEAESMLASVRKTLGERHDITRYLEKMIAMHEDETPSDRG